MRLFLALDGPGAVRSACAQMQRRLRADCRGWRWIDPQAIHLTLRFLGETDDDQDRRGRSAWREAAAGFGPLRLRLGGVGRFPARGPARVLWLGVRARDPAVERALHDLARRLEQAAVALGYPAERRRFRPHLTLARARRGERPNEPPQVPGSEAEVETSFTELVLFQSELRPEGARYTVLERFPFAPSAPPGESR